MMSFQNKFVKSLGHINPNTVMEKVATSYRLVLPIRVSLIEINIGVGTQLMLEIMEKILETVFD